MNFSSTAIVVTVNVALGEDAMQSSTFKKREAALAVDGDYETASCTGMESDSPWWAVDLGWGFHVDKVRVTNEKYIINYGELIVLSKYMFVSPLCLANSIPNFH